LAARPQARCSGAPACAALGAVCRRYRIRVRCHLACACTQGATSDSPRHLFLVGLLLTTFSAISVWVVFNQSGVSVQVGPFTWRGPGAERFGITMATIAALIMLAMTAYVWHRWWRALKAAH